MRKFHSGLVAVCVAVSLLATPVAAASLLGGLIKTGSDSGNSGGLVSTNGDGSIGVGGSGGVSVNLGLGGGGDGATGGGSSNSGGGLVGSLTGGSGGGNIGVPGIADVTTGTGSGGGSQVGVSLLGGSTPLLSNNPLGLLGNGGGLSVSLPGLGGTPGAPGAPGSPGVPGGSGSNGYNGFNGSNGYDGGGVVIPGDISSRLRTILAMLAQRDWIRMVNGRAICLANFGTTEISAILPRRDWSGLNAALPGYARDIATLRQLLANCRSAAQRQALGVRDLNRVIGIDIARDGTPVLYLL